MPGEPIERGSIVLYFPLGLDSPMTVKAARVMNIDNAQQTCICVLFGSAPITLYDVPMNVLINHGPLVQTLQVQFQAEEVQRLLEAAHPDYENRLRLLKASITFVATRGMGYIQHTFFNDYPWA